MKDIVRINLVKAILSELKDRYKLEQITEKKYDKLRKFVKIKLNTGFASFDLFKHDDKDFCKYFENKILDDDYLHEVLKNSDDLCGLLENKLDAVDFICELEKIILAEKVVCKINDTYIYDIKLISNKNNYFALNNQKCNFITDFEYLSNVLFYILPGNCMACSTTLPGEYKTYLANGISTRWNFNAFEIGDNIYVFKTNDEFTKIESSAQFNKDKCHSEEDIIKEYYRYVISRNPKQFKNVESRYFRDKNNEFVRELLDIIEKQLNDRVDGKPSFRDKEYRDEVKAVVVEKLAYEAQQLENGKDYREENAEFFGEQKAKLNGNKNGGDKEKE